jgi:hypothetical protein
MNGCRPPFLAPQASLAQLASSRLASSANCAHVERLGLLGGGGGQLARVWQADFRENLSCVDPLEVWQVMRDEGRVTWGTGGLQTPGGGSALLCPLL